MIQLKSVPLVVGGLGADLAIGGEGADVFEYFSFQFEVGQPLDIIQDFQPGLDSIVIVGSTDTTYDPVNGIIAVDGQDVITLASEPDLNVIIRGNSSVLV